MILSQYHYNNHDCLTRYHVFFGHNITKKYCKVDDPRIYPLRTGWARAAGQNPYGYEPRWMAAVIYSCSGYTYVMHIVFTVVTHVVAKRMCPLQIIITRTTPPSATVIRQKRNYAFSCSAILLSTISYTLYYALRS